MNTKTLDAKIRVLRKDDAGGDGGVSDAGQFEAVVSVFDNRDSYGDVIRKGAFTATLAAWEAKGLPIPIYYSHRLDDPDFNIGHVVSATETDKGLHIVGQLDLDTAKAQQVHRLFKARRLSQFSFSYAVVDGSVETDKATGEEFNELRALDVFEVGPTPVGANSETELIAVKDAGYVARGMARRARAKAGAELSDDNISTLENQRDALRSAADEIDAVIVAVQGPSEDPSSGTAPDDGTGSSKAEELVRAKAEDSDRRASSATGAADIPSPSSALNALLLLDIRSLSHVNHHSRTA